MDSTRLIPFHAAAAYGMKPLRSPAPTTQPAFTGTAAFRTPATAVSFRSGDTIQPPVQPAGARASAATKLVGGKVQSPVSRGQGFDAPGRSAVPNPTGSLQMYSRAADRVEVATAAHLGRMLDTRA
jgi:hypothetical protein